MKKLSLLFVMVTCLVFTISCVSKEVPVTETYFETEYKTETYTEIGEKHEEDLQPVRAPWRGWFYFEGNDKTSNELNKLLLGTFYRGYEISTVHPQSQIRIILSQAASSNPWIMRVYDLTGVGQIPPPPERGAGEGKTSYNFEKGVMEYISSPREQEFLANLNAVITDPKRVMLSTRWDLPPHLLSFVVNATGVKEFAIMTSSNVEISFYDRQDLIGKVQLIWRDEVTKERQVPYQVEKQRTVIQTNKVPFWEVIFH